MRQDLSMQKKLLMTSITAIQLSHAKNDNSKIGWHQVSKIQMATLILIMFCYIQSNSVGFHQKDSQNKWDCNRHCQLTTEIATD